MSDGTQYPLYGSTFHAYRATPLFHGQRRILSPSGLQLYARRMRNVLKGDNLHGVDVGLSAQDSTIANLGPLEDCTWELLGDESAWETEQTEKAQDDEMSDELAPATRGVTADDARGIHIQLQYSKTTHSALLLRGASASKAPEQFTSLPLMLLRMPQPLRESVISYLTTAFDTRIAPLPLPPAFLTSTLESLLTRLSSKTSSSTISSTLKNLQIQLSLPTAAPLLKIIEITISRDDISGFHTRGAAILASQSSLYPSVSTPLTTALIQYLTTHLALEAQHILPSISKIACAIFALSADSKLKLTPPPIPDNTSSTASALPRNTSPVQQFMVEFYARLVAEASRNSMAADNMPVVGKAGVSAGEKVRSKRAATAESDAASIGRKRGRPRKAGAANADRPGERGASSEEVGVPLDPPPPYELHDLVRTSAR